MAAHATDISSHSPAKNQTLISGNGMLETMLRSSHDCVIELNDCLEIEQIINGLPGFDTGSRRGICILDLLHADEDRLRILRLLQRAQRSSEPVAFRVALSVNNGDGLILDANAVAEANPDPSRRPWVLVSGRDVSVRVQLEQQNRELTEKLQRMERLEMVERMASGIAHDFNSMLHPIIAFASMGLRKTEDQVDLQSYFNSINIAAQRARDVAQKILVFSRDQPSESLPVRLSDIVEEVVHMQRAGLPANIDIEQKMDRSCGPVSGDPTQLHQVVMNLVTNGLHAMKKTGGVLSIDLHPVKEIPGRSPAHAGAVCLAVTDTGTGMSPEVVDKMFTPFYSTKPKSQGTGLGLSIVAKIIEGCNGRIEVSSTPGKGSEFKIYLPGYSANNDSDSLETTADDLPAGDEHLLLVDPEKNGVNSCEETLASLGYTVQTCTSGDEAWKMVESNPTAFDLVLTHLTLPGMSGYRLALKVLDIRPDMSIILSLTRNAPINMQQARSIGIREVLLKPFTEKQLTATLRSVLDS